MLPKEANGELLECVSQGWAGVKIDTIADQRDRGARPMLTVSRLLDKVLPTAAPMGVKNIPNTVML